MSVSAYGADGCGTVSPELSRRAVVPAFFSLVGDRIWWQAMKPARETLEV
jgi:hypothetical protein